MCGESVHDSIVDNDSIGYFLSSLRESLCLRWFYSRKGLPVHFSSTVVPRDSGLVDLECDVIHPAKLLWPQGWENGHCSYQWLNGDEYEGEFIKGKLQRGTCKYANGDLYTGNFHHPSGSGKVNYERHGRGTLKRANGDVYVGKFKRNKYHGKGTLTNRMRCVL